MIEDFNELVGNALTAALSKQGITEPTEIQKQAIPIVLSGQDLIASSETGSGKTLAYLLPIFKKIDPSLRAAQAVIITPTHELAAQVNKQAELLTAALNPPVSSALIIGGANLARQLEQIKQKPKIIIGSAGRILELIKMKKLSVHNVKTIVIDEADKLLDENNINMITSLVKCTLSDRQVLIFSASITEKAEAAGKSIMKQPDVIRIKSESALPENIEHMVFIAQPRDKIKVLRKIIHSEKITRAIVFLNNPNNIEEMTERLNYHGIKSAAIYGSALKAQRRLALENLRNGKITVLVASDMAARGLDIKDLTHVINLDAPEKPNDYLHRAGRVGRMGEYGLVITIATEYEKRYLKKYENAFNISITEKEMAFGDIIDI